MAILIVLHNKGLHCYCLWLAIGALGTQAQRLLAMKDDILLHCEKLCGVPPDPLLHVFHPIILTSSLKLEPSKAVFPKGPPMICHLSRVRYSATFLISTHRHLTLKFSHLL